MSKSLKSMKPEERSAAIARRLAQGENGTKGLGYWGALDAKRKKG